MVSAAQIVALSDPMRFVLSICALVIPFVALGTLVGFVWRGRSLCAFLACFPASVALAALLALIAGQLHWWWETPADVFYWYIGLFVVLQLTPAISLRSQSALCAGHVKPSNQAMQRTAARSAFQLE